MSLAARQRLALIVTCAVPLLIVFTAELAALPFVAALLLALLLDPLVRRLVRVGAGETAAAAITTALATLITFTIVFGAVPIFLQDVQGLVETLTDSADELVDRLAGIWARWLPGGQSLREALRTRAEELAPSADNLAPALEQLVSVGGAVATAILFVLLVPVALFFLLREGRGFRDGLIALLPRPYHAPARELVIDIGAGLGDYMRGQALVCTAQAIYHATGLMLIGLDFGLVIGVLTGIGAIVPIIGNAALFIVAIAVALVQFDGWLGPFGVLALYGSAQMLETLLLVPLLIGRQIAVHPLLMIVAAILGGRLFGFVGALLALPGTTVLVVTGRWFWARYRRTEIYDATAADARDPYEDVRAT
ncbi:MAG: AI-2E family transporter [Alphaproteobacteria bacterium]